MHEHETRAFVKIAEIGYSQPALSYQVRCLEQELRTRLFDRDTLGARLTAEGRAILPSAKAMHALFDGSRATVTGPVRHPLGRALVPVRST